MAERVIPVRSNRSFTACYLRFINRTSRRANIIWIDYNGLPVTYGTLEPGMHFDIHTYEGHPWVSEDSSVRTRLLLNGARVFYASANDQEIAQRNRESRNYLPFMTNHEGRRNENYLYRWRRQLVDITIPVLSLVDRTAEIINSSVRHRDDVYSLNIPTRLKDFLFEANDVQNFVP